MNTGTTQERSPYVSPKTSLLELVQGGILCTSNESWYSLKGQGDFSYDVVEEEEDAWK